MRDTFIGNENQVFERIISKNVKSKVMSEISKYISHNDVKKKILIKDTENHIKT